MDKAKAWGAACALALMAACAQARAGEKVVLYGDDDYAPYSYVEDDGFKGMYVDILSAAAKRLAPQYEVELRPIPWKRGLIDLEVGRSFALFPPGRKAERRFVQPYSAPLFKEQVVLFCAGKAMEVPRKSFPEDFKGLTIGVNAGFLLSKALMDAAAQGEVTLDSAKGNEANVKKLAAGRIDCYASDRGAAVFTAKQLRASGELSPKGFELREAATLSEEETFIGYSSADSPPWKADFVQKMDAAIEAMRRSGELGRIQAHYMRQ